MNVTIIGLVIGLKTDECIPKKNIVHIAKFNPRTAHGLSIDPTNGAKNLVSICGGNSPNIANDANLATIKVPPTIILLQVNLLSYL